MKDSIRLSEKHGVNPAMGVCFWCGKEDGTILLLGKLPKNAEAPRHVCASYEPCDECKKNFALGIAFVEVLDDGSPTGRFVVIKEEAVKEMGIQPQELLESILEKRRANVRPYDFNAMFTH